MVFWAIEERGCPCGASWTEADAAFDGEVGKKLGFWRSPCASTSCTNSLGAESPHSGGCEISC